ncbi:helix-turn-helix transcriptional regulator [Candidatus Galacturonibacter soehngenii]|uniref:WYL domain-containing protein n=1 Tax=Candidatus Galacturonatibacter soehngenii TaxID=2307010 RepID=A0A7V7UC22_9FIRM|nr:WYL domain-containing protein [Candidatus Galacturonibacter soehngenii]KAB1438375.1 WYL domain-containing protein [Candidatus Galacturonibacter soehngenii]
MQSQVAGQLDYNYVICALQGLASAFENKEIQATLEKIKSLNDGKNQTMIFDLSVAHENRNTNEMLYVLNQCINDKQVIQFIYTNANDETKQVVVEPISTLYKWYNWYLIGYSRRHQEYRLYKVVRMDQLSALVHEKVKVHDLNKVQEIMQNAKENRKIIRIVMKCNKILHAKCREYFKATILEVETNGDFVCEALVPEEEIFWYGILLFFKDKIQVLEPPELIRRIKEDCNNILKVYED